MSPDADYDLGWRSVGGLISGSGLAGAAQNENALITPLTMSLLSELTAEPWPEDNNQADVPGRAPRRVCVRRINAPLMWGGCGGC